MTCIIIPKHGDVGPTFICGPDAVIYLCFECQTIRLEYHNYMGPHFWRMPERSGDEEMDQETEVTEPMWDLFYEWLERYEKTTKR